MGEEGHWTRAQGQSWDPAKMWTMGDKVEHCPPLPISMDSCHKSIYVDQGLWMCCHTLGTEQSPLKYHWYLLWTYKPGWKTVISSDSNRIEGPVSTRGNLGKWVVRGHVGCCGSPEQESATVSELVGIWNFDCRASVIGRLPPLPSNYQVWGLFIIQQVLILLSRLNILSTYDVASTVLGTRITTQSLHLGSFPHILVGIKPQTDRNK